jgi:hypothetical protein
MQDYEDSIIDKVGYNEYMKIKTRIMDQLLRYEELKEEVGNTDNMRQYTKLVRNNIWEFNKRYFAPGDQEFQMIEQGGVKQYFAGFSSGENSLGLQYIPKTNPELKYYSEEFKEIRNDEQRYKMWYTVKNMLSYINDAYVGNDFGVYYAPKIARDTAEEIMEQWDNLKSSPLGSIKGVARLMAHNWRGLYFSKLPEGPQEKGKKVRSNNLDTSRQDFLKLKEVIMIDNPKLTEEEAGEEARKRLESTYSSNIERSLKASLISASLHQARLRTEPLASAMVDTYKNIKTGKEGDKHRVTRKRGIERLEHFVHKVIYNESNTTNQKTFEGRSIIRTKLFNLFSPKLKEKTKLFTDQEKEFVKVAEKILNDRLRERNPKHKDKGFVQILATTSKKELQELGVEEELGNALIETGQDLSISSFVEGMLKANILKHLGFKMDSGFTNRIEGKNNNIIEDARGVYWTPGNMITAQDMLSWANITEGAESLKRVMTKKNFGLTNTKAKQMHIFRHILERVGGLQDRKDELQKASKANTPEGKISNAVFSWAITKPEFKNQGEIMLAVMMDKKITDNNGVPHPFLDPETGEFTALDLDDSGNVIIKPQFSESFSLVSQDVEIGSQPDNTNLLERIANQARLSISAIQGNYSGTDAMKIKAYLLGRAAMNFLTWLPAQTIKRWGMFNLDGQIDIDPATNKPKRDGIYVESLRASPLTAITAYGIGAVAMGSLTHVAIGTVLSLFGAYMAYKTLKSLKNDVNRDVTQVLTTAIFMLDTLRNTVVYPLKLFSSAPGLKHLLKIEVDLYKGQEEKKKLNSHEIAALKALSRELGIKIGILLVKLGIGMLMWDDDDPSTSRKRRLFYYLQNLLYKNLSALEQYSQPTAIWNDVVQLSIARDLVEIYKGGQAFLSGDVSGFADAVRTQVPLSTDVLAYDKNKGFQLYKNPFLEDYMLETSYMITDGLKTHEWYRFIYKNYHSDGTYSLKKELKAKRETLAGQIEKDFENDLTADQLSTLKRIIKRQRIPDRPDNLTPEQLESYVEDVNIDTYYFEDYGIDYSQSQINKMMKEMGREMKDYIRSLDDKSSEEKDEIFQKFLDNYTLE